MKIRLIGDHSQYHCGSAAAFRAITAACNRAGRIVPDGDDFDTLVVNGEGSMHHDSSTCKKKLQEIETAIANGKKVYLMNTVWQENSASAADVLRQCERVTVREVLSQAALRDIGVESDVAIDQSFFDPVSSDGPSVDFDNQAVLTDFYSKDLGTFARVTTQWTWNVPYVQMHEWEWSDLVRSLRSASILLTGRHHAVYASCRARTPFLALRGNTHKIEGLIATSGVDIPIFDNYKDLLKTYRTQKWRNYNYTQLFDWMEAQEPWTLTKS